MAAGNKRTFLLLVLLAALAAGVFALLGLDPGDVVVEDDAVETGGAPRVEEPREIVLENEGGRTRASAGATTLSVEALLPDGSVNLATRAWAVHADGTSLPRKLAPTEWKGIPAGEWTVHIEAVNFLPGEESITITEGETKNVQLKLREGARVKGRVVSRVGKPVNGMVVWFLRDGMASPKKDEQSGQKPESTTSRSDGGFRSRLLEPGHVRVYVDPLGRQQRVLESSMHLKPGEEREAEIVIPGGGTVAVRIANPPSGSEKVRAGLLEMRRTGRNVSWMSAGIRTVDDLGVATFDNLKPGSDYRVEIRHGRAHYTSEQNFTFRANQNFEASVTLPEGGGERKAPLRVNVQQSLTPPAGREPGVYWD